MKTIIHCLLAILITNCVIVLASVFYLSLSGNVDAARSALHVYHIMLGFITVTVTILYKK